MRRHVEYVMKFKFIFAIYYTKQGLKYIYLFIRQIPNHETANSARINAKEREEEERQARRAKKKKEERDTR